MNMQDHLRRQMAFSRWAFGPGERRKGVIDHIRKELVEIEGGGGGPEEWVDVVILALDGLTRALANETRTTFSTYRDGHENRTEEKKVRVRKWEDVPETALRMIVSKQSKNEQRDWPDWRTAPKDRAIEHVRYSEPCSTCGGNCGQCGESG